MGRGCPGFGQALKPRFQQEASADAPLLPKLRNYSFPKNPRMNGYISMICWLAISS